MGTRLPVPTRHCPVDQERIFVAIASFQLMVAIARDDIYWRKLMLLHADFEQVHGLFLHTAYTQEGPVS